MTLFSRLRSANARRCHQSFHSLNAWSPTDWSNAVAGEAGELCNITKKMLRIAPNPEAPMTGQELMEYNALRMKAGDEIADTVIYCDLLATRLGFRLADLVVGKFNEVSARVGSNITLVGETDAEEAPCTPCQ